MAMMVIADKATLTLSKNLLAGNGFDSLWSDGGQDSKFPSHAAGPVSVSLLIFMIMYSSTRIEVKFPRILRGASFVEAV